MKNLIIDTSNILFRVAAMNQKQYFSNEEERAGLALHVGFQSINKYYKKFKPDRLIFTFEGTNNWRKEYSTSKTAVRKQLYKGNRPKDKSMIPFFELINSFRDVMENHTCTYCISNDHCEADDIIAGIVQMRDDRTIEPDFLIQPNDEIIILSGDKDFVQLLEHNNVRLIDPQTGEDKMKANSMKNYVNDIPFYMFEKCVRGDKGDNVFSAFPRVRKTKIREAFEDDYERLQFMNEVWNTQDDEGNIVEKYRVGDLFEENKVLIDLTCQPQYVKNSMYNSIHDVLSIQGKYNHFQFMKFLGKNGLINMAENIHLFVNMLSNKHVIQRPTRKLANNFKQNTYHEQDDSNVITEDRTKSKNNVIEY